MGWVEPVHAETWHDTFYQYRIPVTLRSDAIGWHEAPITAKDIVTRSMRARQGGLEVSDQQRVLDDLKRFFVGPVHWSQNDAWYWSCVNAWLASIEQLHSEGVVP